MTEGGNLGIWGCIVSSLLQQIKTRRLALGLKQSEMPLRISVLRLQDQRLEARVIV